MICKCGAPAREQYSYGVYAGRYCDECASRRFRDNCGHRPEGQGNPQDLDEPLDPC